MMLQGIRRSEWVHASLLCEKYLIYIYITDKWGAPSLKKITSGGIFLFSSKYVCKLKTHKHKKMIKLYIFLHYDHLRIYFQSREI